MPNTTKYEFFPLLRLQVMSTFLQGDKKLQFGHAYLFDPSILIYNLSTTYRQISTRISKLPLPPKLNIHNKLVLNKAKTSHRWFHFPRPTGLWLLTSQLCVHYTNTSEPFGSWNSRWRGVSFSMFIWDYQPNQLIIQQYFSFIKNQSDQPDFSPSVYQQHQRTLIKTPSSTVGITMYSTVQARRVRRLRRRHI
jgi:hypothetical protein